MVDHFCATYDFLKNFDTKITSVYKAGFSTVEHLNNLVTKIITKYPVLTTHKILKNSKKHLQFFYYF